MVLSPFSHPITLNIKFQPSVFLILIKESVLIRRKQSSRSIVSCSACRFHAMFSYRLESLLLVKTTDRLNQKDYFHSWVKNWYFKIVVGEHLAKYTFEKDQSFEWKNWQMSSKLITTAVNVNVRELFLFHTRFQFLRSNTYYHKPFYWAFKVFNFLWGYQKNLHNYKLQLISLLNLWRTAQCFRGQGSNPSHAWFVCFFFGLSYITPFNYIHTCT